MSLKRALDDPRSALRCFLDATLPNGAAARADWQRTIAANSIHLPAPTGAVPGSGAPRRYPADEVGHAFSVRAALLFTPDVWPAARVPVRHPYGGPWPAAARAHATFTALATAGTGFGGVSRQQERDLARWCYLAGLFDRLSRSGPLPGMPLLDADSVAVEDLLTLVPERCLDDVAALTDVARDCLAPLADPEQRVVAGPRFAGSPDVGDAEADLLVGSTLLELKVTGSNRLTKRQLQQLVTYALLDYEDEYAITRVALYSARFGCLIVWPLRQLLDRLSGRAVAVGELRRRLREHLTAR